MRTKTRYRKQLYRSAKLIKTDMSVGITNEIAEALGVAIAFSGLKASQYARIGLVEKLCRENFLRHPGLAHLEEASTKRKPNGRHRHDGSKHLEPRYG
jgi:hypothetical protein